MALYSRKYKPISYVVYSDALDPFLSTSPLVSVSSPVKQTPDGLYYILYSSMVSALHAVKVFEEYCYVPKGRLKILPARVFFHLHSVRV